MWILYATTANIGLTLHFCHSTVRVLKNSIKYILQILRLQPPDIQQQKVKWPLINTQNRGTKENPHHVIIVGAGFSGIGMAVRFKQESLHDFIILERGSDIGGTWFFNKYPNCACVRNYKLSFNYFVGCSELDV
jgi:hypothetical protein